MKPTNNVFYATIGGKISVIDEVMEREDGSLVGKWSGNTWEQYANQYGGCAIADGDEVVKLIETSLTTEPVAISEEDWMYGLECMPPVKWESFNGVESFRFMELTSYSITDIYARIGESFFKFQDRIDMTFEDLSKKVLDHVARVKTSSDTSAAAAASSGA